LAAGNGTAPLVAEHSTITHHQSRTLTTSTVSSHSAVPMAAASWITAEWSALVERGSGEVWVAVEQPRFRRGL